MAIIVPAILTILIIRRIFDAYQRVVTDRRILRCIADDARHEIVFLVTVIADANRFAHRVRAAENVLRHIFANHHAPQFVQGRLPIAGDQRKREYFQEIGIGEVDEFVEVLSIRLYQAFTPRHHAGNAFQFGKIGLQSGRQRQGHGAIFDNFFRAVGK